MDVFELRKKIVTEDYAKYASSFIDILDERIRKEVDEKFSSGLLWPDPLLQLNPSFRPAGSIDDLVRAKKLDPDCARIFRRHKSKNHPTGDLLTLHQHQREALEIAQKEENYILATGTGSGKSLTYILPIVDYILNKGSGNGIQAIIVYPMNALANSQMDALNEYLKATDEKFPVTFARYTGQENENERQAIIVKPPDILLTNYVMLELLLTRPQEKTLINTAMGLKFLVFDELHTYRGRQGADVAMLIRRLAEKLCPDGRRFQCIGTSATLASSGSFEEKRREIASITTRIFGSPIKPENVIMETLISQTGDYNPDNAFLSELASFIASDEPLPVNYSDFIKNPLAKWLEHAIGVEKREGRLERSIARPLTGPKGLAPELAMLVGQDEERCAAKIREAMLTGSNILKPDNRDEAVFAFKLHQFISKGDTVYATIEDADKRYLTLFGQKLAPGRDDKALLYGLKFCRECGKEYYPVTLLSNDDGFSFVPHNPDDPDSGQPGYIFLDGDNPWPQDTAELLERIPPEWLDEKNGQLTINSRRKGQLPERWFVLPDGTAFNKPNPEATPVWFMKGVFTFCPHCLVQYPTNQKNNQKDFKKLATLGSEGRTSATTVLSMSAVNHLRKEPSLPENARKFLCFSDNRQDVSLQAGHFNDFVEVCLIRSALYNALARACDKGLEHTELPFAVQEALGASWPGGKFPGEKYLADPETIDLAGLTDKLFCQALEYRIYADLKRDWRIMLPNLEQTGLLKIEYPHLDELCAIENAWQDYPELRALKEEQRKEIGQTLLDFMRRQLAIKKNILLPEEQQRFMENQKDLLPQWQLGRSPEQATMALPRTLSTHESNNKGFFSVSYQSDYGKWLKRKYFSNASNEELAQHIKNLFAILKQYKFLEHLNEDIIKPDSGFLINPACMRWKAGDGSPVNLYPWKIYYAAGKKGRVNPYFVDLYRTMANSGSVLRSEAHTAQIAGELRAQRENDFVNATLPILYCSPTMELGVDIKNLNAVGLRNVPPTPANYAQRSGRSGRSGQSALVITYCSRDNSHDQNFFRSPEKMVSGAVLPPRIDLANEDLVRSHVHAVWLAEADLNLHKSLSDIINVNDPDLGLDEEIRDEVAKKENLRKAEKHAENILKQMEPELLKAPWYDSSWLNRIINKIPEEFEKACERWRNLFKAANTQLKEQNKKSEDHSLSKDQKNAVEALRDEARYTLEHLQNKGIFSQSDFYSYRYFASEGFLPGYNFPRLPLTAMLSGNGQKSRSRYSKKESDSISRSRFLAISEFGPNNIIYHEGSRYSVKKLIIDSREESSLVLDKIKLCEHCGHLEKDLAKDKCEICEAPFTAASTMKNLNRMGNVNTVQISRITANEERRLPLGYEIISGYRFVEHGAKPSYLKGVLQNHSGACLATLRYGHGADIWRINLGWRNRKSGSQNGFYLDEQTGYWLKDDSDSSSKKATKKKNSPQTQAIRVIPNVKDTKNCLVFMPNQVMTQPEMLTLQSALKQAILQIWQLEDSEISTEVLPSIGEPKTILFVESSEGGAGILRNLLEDPDALKKIAKKALEICHFDEDGKDLGKAENAPEPCVAACYDCLMNYTNQSYHRQLDRHLCRDILLDYSKGTVRLEKDEDPVQKLANLKKLCESELERKWLDFLIDHELRLPDKAQHLIEKCHCRPDFWYEEDKCAIFIDGPHHDSERQMKKDAATDQRLENEGITSIFFMHNENWLAKIRNYRSIFKYKER